MADVITRLKLESGEYDSKIKRAVTGLQRMEDECRKVGGTLAILEKDQKQYVESLGRMQTVSTSVRGKIGELSNAYVELRSQYNRLTQEEKKGDFGKALSASLDQLKTRINDSKKELNDINAELGNTTQSSGGASRALEELAGKFGLNVGALTKLGGALAVAGGAVKVATDAFMQNESNVDSWGRTVEATGSIYQSFLQSLNNSDFSGFLSGIGRVIQAAKDAYNAMDELNTRMTIINPERAKLQARQTQLKATIRRNGADSAAGKAAQNELKKMEPQLVKSYQTEAKMNRDAFAAALRQRLAEGNIKVSESEFGALLSTFSDDRKFRQFRANAKGSKGTKVVGSAYSDSQQIIEYDTRNKNQRIAELITDEWRQKYSPYLTASYNAQGQAYSTLLGDARYVKAAKGGTGSGSRTGGKNTPKVEEVFPEGSMKDLQRDMQELKKAQDLVTSPDEWQKYQQQIDAVTEKMNTLRGVAQKAPEMAEGVSGLNQKAIATYQSMLQESMKGMEYGSTDLTQTLANSIDVTTLSNLLKTTLDQGLDITKMKFENGSPVIESLWEAILSGKNIDDKVWEDLANIFSEQLKAKGGKGIKINTATGAVSEEQQQAQVDYLQQMQKLNSGLSSVNSGLQQIGIKLPDGMQKMLTVMQGVTSVIQGVQTVISVFSTSSQSANTAAVMANTGTITALTAAVVANTAALSVNTTSNFIPFATGGIVHAAGGVMVPGNSFSGDRVPALLNSGELVLNKAQQYNLASQLEGNGNQGGGTPMLPYVSGDKIILGANNFLKGAGKGELVTTSYLRQKGLI